MSDEEELDDLIEPGPLYVPEQTCECGASLRFRPDRGGYTVGGLYRFGWWSCTRCERGYLPSKATLDAYRTEIQAAERATRNDQPWTVAKGGRSIVCGGIKLRPERGDADEIRALLERIEKLPELEREIARLRAQMEAA